MPSSSRRAHCNDHVHRPHPPPMSGTRSAGPSFAGRRVVVAGIALSGAAVADALLDRGAHVVVVDGRDGPEERTTAQRLSARGATVRLGDGETPVDADLVVTSPGWRPTQPLLAAALGAGVEVIGEPELAWRLRDGSGGAAAPWVAVTGTNGKTTTVGMVESILTAAGYRAVAAGNVGRPLIDVVLARPAYDVIAVELSSFQLHWSKELAPDVGAVLNVKADHLGLRGIGAASSPRRLPSCSTSPTTTSTGTGRSTPMPPTRPGSGVPAAAAPTTPTTRPSLGWR